MGTIGAPCCSHGLYGRGKVTLGVPYCVDDLYGRGVVVIPKGERFSRF